MNIYVRLLFALIIVLVVIAAFVTVNRIRKKTGYEAAVRELTTSLKTSDVGMSCGDYSLLVIAGPNSKDLPGLVRKKMQMHEKSCEYHRSSEGHQSALSTPVTPKMEKAADDVIKKYANAS